LKNVENGLKWTYNKSYDVHNAIMHVYIIFWDEIFLTNLTKKNCLQAISNTTYKVHVWYHGSTESKWAMVILVLHRDTKYEIHTVAAWKAKLNDCIWLKGDY